MVLDTSALLAALQEEPERRAFNVAIEAAGACRLSAASLVEASIVNDARYGSAGVRDLDLFLARVLGEPLLFKGDDFGQTDVASAVS